MSSNLKLAPQERRILDDLHQTLTDYQNYGNIEVSEQRHDSSYYRLNKSVLERDNFDSVFAHGGADLRNNEYVVYDSSQCTVSFLVEIDN